MASFDVKELAHAVTEGEGIVLLEELMQVFGWSGIVFTSDDVLEAFSRVDPGASVYRTLYRTKEFKESDQWRGLQDYLSERGWDRLLECCISFTTERQEYDGRYEPDSAGKSS